METHLEWELCNCFCHWFALECDFVSASERRGASMLDSNPRETTQQESMIVSRSDRNCSFCWSPMVFSL